MFILNQRRTGLININAFDKIKSKIIDIDEEEFQDKELGFLIYGIYSQSRKPEMLGITFDPERVFILLSQGNLFKYDSEMFRPYEYYKQYNETCCLDERLLGRYIHEVYELWESIKELCKNHC